MTLAVIPARGGSQGLKRKNLLPIGGVPAVLASAYAAREAGCDVVVSTDDPEIASLVAGAGFDLHIRGPELAEVVVDEVVRAAAQDWRGDVLLVQPTVQPITGDIIGWFLDRAQGVPMHLFRRFPHQIWADGDWVTPRVNRQDIEDPPLLELGIRWWPNVDCVGDPQVNQIIDVRFIDVDVPLVDIDTADDWRAAQPRRTITLVPLADDTHGRGHLRRCLAIAERLQHHLVVFDGTYLDGPARHLIEGRGWPLRLPVVERGGDGGFTVHEDRMFWENTIDLRAHLWVYDCLDRGERGGLRLETTRTDADYTINALYEDGADWCVLRPEFLFGNYEVRPDVKRIMVMFGGTDPGGLGYTVTDTLTRQGYDVFHVQPHADIRVAAEMRASDLLITSGGRTVFEAAAVGIPTIVMAQNLRETTHTHLGYEHGNVYLGLGKLVTPQTLLDTVCQVALDHELRVDLSARGRPDGKGLDRIVAKIEEALR